MFPTESVICRENGGGGNRTRETFPPEFGHWLAGFTDGEGCFHIAKRVPKNGRQTYGCSFSIKVRADDGDLIRSLPEITGIGSVRRQKASVDERRANNPAIRWDVVTANDCLELVAIFTRYPLRSKKSRDFEIWKRAVEYWTNPVRERVGLTGRGGARWFVHHELLAVLREELTAAKAYVDA